MDDRKMSQLADDVHLITMPVRTLADRIRILIFIAVLLIAFIVSVVIWLVTGKRIMSPDEIWPTKILLTVLSPWITTLSYLIYKHWRIGMGHEYRSPVPNLVVFVSTILIMLAIVKCNFPYGWGLYR